MLPRVFARPLELRRGQSLTDRQLVDRLNDLGYAQRLDGEKPGEFALERRHGVDHAARRRVQGQDRARRSFQRAGAGGKATPRERRRCARPITSCASSSAPQTRAADARRAPADSLISGEREKRRPVALSPSRRAWSQAVLAIEDRRFYDHPGVDPIGMGGAVLSYRPAAAPRMAGGSTITQQLVRNVFLPKFDGMTLQNGARAIDAAARSLEMFVSLILTIRASKDEILEMYLNDVPLGQRGSFAIFGVAEASRLFFGKDVSNVSLAEAATIAGVIQSPSALSPFNNPARCRERRNVVLPAMADAGYIEPTRPNAPPRSRSPSSSARSKPRRRTSSTTSARRSTSTIPA